MINTVVGIDVGGTNSPFGFVDKEGKIIAKGSIRTDEYEKFDDYLNALISEIKRTNREHNLLKIVGYGIGAPNGNYYKGTVENAPNLRWKGKIEFAHMMTEKTGLKAYLTNDANAAAIGEKVFGNAKGMNDFIVITLGTGLGSGIFCGGKLLYGSTGFAGELGHTIVLENDRLCGCTRHGCLETYASATGIVRTVIEKLSGSGIDSSLRKHREDEITSKLIHEAAVAGDKLALDSFEYTGAILGKALANAVAFSSPEAIFLFGGLANSGSYIFEPTVRHMEENMLNNFKGTVKVLPSGLQENTAAILGAAALCWNEVS
ncbi:MAG: ROK family protein [Ignavibacteria bacterium]